MKGLIDDICHYAYIYMQELCELFTYINIWTLDMKFIWTINRVYIVNLFTVEWEKRNISFEYEQFTFIVVYCGQSTESIIIKCFRLTQRGKQKAEECAAFLTPTNTRNPIKLLISHPSNSHQQTGRLIQSAALYTIWKAYTHHVFGGRPTPNHQETQQTLTNLILSFRSTALASQKRRNPPWPPVKSIIDIIRL